MSRSRVITIIRQFELICAYDPEVLEKHTEAVHNEAIFISMFMALEHEDMVNVKVVFRFKNKKRNTHPSCLFFPASAKDYICSTYKMTPSQ